MAFQLLASVIYEAIRHSWLVSTVVVKYILVGYIGGLVYSRKLGRESFLDLVDRYSRETVAAIIVTGIFFSAVSLRPEPALKLFSQITALVYFGYLFWEY